MKIFDYLNALTDKKEDLDFDDDNVSSEYLPFMVNRWISMAEIYIPVVNEINKYDIPKKYHFKYYESILPKRKQYFSYIKKVKDLDDKEKSIIADYFEIGMKDADEYIRTMDESEIKQILDIYKHGKNKMIEV